MMDLVKRFGHAERLLIPSPQHVALRGSVVSAGVSRETGPDYDWKGLERGAHELCLLQHTLSGRGMLCFEGRTSEVPHGTTLLLNIPHDHRYYAREDVAWEFFYVLLNGSEISRLWRQLILHSGPLVRLDPEGVALTEAARLCAWLLGERIESPFAASQLAYSLTMALLDEVVGDRGRDAPPAFIAKVDAFCRKSFARPIGVEDMARAAGMSRYHFSRRFREVQGVSPGRYLAELRLREAVRLVQDSDLPIREIAARTGYSDVNYFFKVFQRRFGMSTRAFRKRRG